MLTVYVDFKSPESYLALRPTLALAEETGVGISWRPFRSSQFSIPEQQESESVGQSHRRVRAQSRHDTFVKYAALQGIDLRLPSAPQPTDLALGVLGQLRDDALPFVEAAFDAYWQRHLSLNSPEVVSSLLAEAMMSFELDPDHAHKVLAQAQDDAEAVGIVETPAFVVADQIFIGREHFPWIKDIVNSF